ncbi:hypothetical protein CVT26_012422 [Gymnopilus dilepis]|uniref:Uncharacterized protein n=1 Tax=Gymnopilus dilepis TaxID=231916 RepID=A0A409YWH0_9AGAR|nr:hypothetical protein CVT26_012422 [Gymnopilus dilepis]
MLIAEQPYMIEGQKLLRADTLGLENSRTGAFDANQGSEINAQQHAYQSFTRGFETSNKEEK